ncbi:Tol biopolymer transport system component [Paenibacillus mucilaginosus]|uniref:TolB family protein n=1 Tax=Paenibacillus mucilaginosus TaxID=61624 RepID=UPI003D22827F
MRPAFVHSIQKKLSVALTTALLISSVLPAAGAAAGPDFEPAFSTVTESGYGTGSVPPPAVQDNAKPTPAGAPLTWSLLTKNNRGFASMLYATYDTPISKLSSDERYLAFMTYPPDDEQAPGRQVVMIRDRSTGGLHRMKTPDETGSVLYFDMTPDARYIAYTYADTVISGQSKVYLYDRTTETLETVNGTTGRNEFRMEEGDYVSISADGRYVAFDTDAEGVVPGDTNGERDVYLFDRLGSGSRLERISVPLEESRNLDSRHPSISSDGDRIVLVSQAKLTDLDEPDGTESLYLYDRQAAAGTYPKRIAEGETPSISGDGRYVAFTTFRDDLVQGEDTNNRDDIYVYDVTDAVFHRVSKEADGTQHTGDSRHPSISRSGAYVAYEVDTSDNGDESELYVADRQGAASARIEVPEASVSLLPSGKRPAVGDTGASVTFFSSYLERIGGVEVRLWDYFVAASGASPSLASGIAPEASDLVGQNQR